jgi:hypothetical protein
MLRAHRLLLTLPWLLGVAGTTQAGENRALSEGSLVRVTAPSVSKGRLTGTLLKANEREIVLALPGSEPKAIPRVAVKRLEWSRGHSRHPVFGAVVGGLLGGAFLAAASLAVCDAASCSPSMEAFVVGAGLGALPGAGIGALVKTRRWDDVEPARLRVSLTPVRGRGVGVKLAVTF